MSAYRALQSLLAAEWLVPWLGRPERVLDLGCGDGGVAEVFDAVGRDVKQFPWPDGQFSVRDARDQQGGPFDLIILRDVLEHVSEHAEVLVRAKDALAPGGQIFVSFPPLWSPFGAHQQSELRGPLRFLPYMHAHPKLRHIIATGLTMRRFERIARECGLNISRKRTFVVRPFAAIRYGLPVVERGHPIGGVWYLLGKEDEGA